ncbi:MAG: HDIG domain-containing protein [Phycisphaerales bacterium]|nr:MAG: HDIG domain-containing protein [Phycisphaerales bacterium]
MFGLTKKGKTRRRQVREQRAKTTATMRVSLLSRATSWPALAGALFILVASAIALFGEATLDYSIGQRIEQPIYAQVSFQTPNPQQTQANRRAARASTPSYYIWSPRAITFDKIRADLMRLNDAAAAAGTFDDFAGILKELNIEPDAGAYDRLRKLAELPDDRGRAQFQEWVDKLPLEREYVVRDLSEEPRDPKSATDHIILETSDQSERTLASEIRHSKLVLQENEKALRGSAADVARRFPLFELKPIIEAIVFAAFQEQPTILYSQDRTAEAMRTAEEAVPDATTSFEADEPYISSPGVLTDAGYDLLKIHRAAYLDFMQGPGPQALKLRQERLLQRVGLLTLVAMLSVGLLVYTQSHQPQIFDNRGRTVAFMTLMLATLLAARLLDVRWGQLPELLLAPCIISASVLAIVYPQRFAIGAICVLVVIVTATVRGDLAFALTMFVGVTVAAYQLNEIRSRTKLISAGAITAVCVMLASAAGGMLNAHSPDFIIQHALWAGSCGLFAFFVVSGVLPFIERIFRVATSLTLLEWRDPTRPLLQLLAREAPGTYNHSLVLGNLVAAACEPIGANGLLAQVGTLYHDIGKIPKSEYFAENQEGQINRHDNLAPTMSLLIILGHVKDGIEMAKEYKLPRVLHQFIEEHHGTTVVRYFHHMASEKQPHIASGKHDREVSEAEFRYAGPKPRSRESAVVMLADGVESAVRALQEPTVGRIESVVHQIVTARLNDGQFSDCDMTMREIKLVDDALVKGMCSIYHGRVAYPKAAKPSDAPAEQERMSV